MSNMGITSLEEITFHGWIQLNKMIIAEVDLCDDAELSAV